MEPLELISTAPKRRRAVLPVAENAPIASVLVDTGVVHLDRPFDYLVPAKWEEVALPGTLVRVPFSGRLCDGIVLERIEASNHQSLKPISSVVSAFPILSQELLRLIDQCRNFYVGTFWDLFRSAVPPRHAKGEKEALAFAGDMPTVPKELPVPIRVESFLSAVKVQKRPQAILLNEQGEKYEEVL
jgi:primosomal protein N' (replication factor Y)